MEQKLSDSVKFSRVKGKSILTTIQRWPKSPFTIHIFGFQAMGNPSGTSTQLSVALLITNFKDYVPKYFQIHSMQIITPRALPAPIQQGNETAARYSVLADFEFTLFGKELLGTSTRQAMTYYPSHHDEGIVWDILAVKQNTSDIGVNPLLVEFTLPHYIPKQPYY